MMSEAKFWKLIDDARAAVKAGTFKNGDEFQDHMETNLRAALTALGAEPLREYAARFFELRGRAYRWDLWGAAYWLCGGCGDDGFTDFRSTLIALGSETYKRVLKDVDSLAEILGPKPPTLQSEGFAYIPMKIYKVLTGKEMDFADFPDGPEEPAGERWDFDDKEETAEHLPRIVKKYPEMGDF